MHVRYLIQVALLQHPHVGHIRYNDAMATIRRVPSMEHTFQLVITRVYEDGNEELIEDEEESELFFALLLSMSAGVFLDLVPRAPPPSHPVCQGCRLSVTRPKGSSRYHSSYLYAYLGRNHRTMSPSLPISARSLRRLSAYFFPYPLFQPTPRH